MNLWQGNPNKSLRFCGHVMSNYILAVHSNLYVCSQNTRQTSANNSKTNRNTRNIGKHSANFYFLIKNTFFYEIYYFLFCALLCPVSPTEILCGCTFFVASKSLSHSGYNHQSKWCHLFYYNFLCVQSFHNSVWFSLILFFLIYFCQFFSSVHLIIISSLWFTDWLFKYFRNFFVYTQQLNTTTKLSESQL